MARDTTTTQLDRPTRARIEAFKVHPRQSVDEIVRQALDALERERREDSRPESRKRAS